jgi:Tol biopolymer transport system component
LYSKAGAIYLSDGMSRGHLILTPDAGIAYRDPAPSPSGGRVAFVRTEEGAPAGSEIWFAAIDGTDPRQLLTDNVGLARQLAWSPSGDQLAWVTDSELRVGNVDSREVLTPTQSTSVRSFAWSPEGGAIAWASAGDAPHALGLLNTATGETRVLAPSTAAGPVAFEPNGRRLLFGNDDLSHRTPEQTNETDTAPIALSEPGVWAVPLTGGAPRNLEPARGVIFSAVAVIESGDRIATVSSLYREAQAGSLIAAAPSGTPAQVLAKDVRPYALPGALWSPGDRAAYLTPPPESGLVTISSDGSGRAAIEAGVDTYAWAPRPGGAPSPV